MRLNHVFFLVEQAVNTIKTANNTHPLRIVLLLFIYTGYQFTGKQAADITIAPPITI